jgi:hypothetical protein
MKRLFTLLAIVSFTIGVFAQAPQRISYQAVVRNSSNALVTSTPIGMRISILQGSESGSALYVETHTPTTNVNGLVTIEIGGGTVVSGSLAAVDLKTGPYFVKSEIAVTAPLTTYTITGTSQLLSVPYALYAESVGSYTETDPVYSAWNKTTGISIASSQVSDFAAGVTNNPAVLANTAKVTNATHTGDATGATALTVVRINGVALAGLPTGLLKNTTGTGVPSVAVAGTDYLTPTGSAALLTDFPVLNQNTTGNAATVTTNANLSGDVTSVGNVTTVGKINGTALAGLTTGLLKNTTATGVPSIAVAGTDYLTPTGSAALLTGFPILNQNTTGNAATVTTIPVLSGDVSSTGNALTVLKINGTSLASLTTGILKNTTGTGVPSIAVAGDFPTLNQNTTGSAASFTGSLVGDVTGTQGATLIANKVTMTATLPVSVTGAPSVIATGPVAISIAPATTSAAGSMSAADKVKLDGLTATSSHYLGESYLGGIIFDLSKDNLGVEHGLVVALTEQPTTKWQNTGTLTGANRTWDGAYNTALITDSPAATYIATLGAGWYLPSIDELSLLWHNRYHVNKALFAAGGTLLGVSDYWSSTEYDTFSAWDFYFYDGKVYNGDKTFSISVRGVKSF